MRCWSGELSRLRRVRAPQRILILAVLVSVVSLGPSARNTSADRVGAGVVLLRADRHGVLFEVTLPLELLQIDPLQGTGGRWVRALVSDWGSTGQPGAPELPAMSVAIGVPFQAEIALDAQPTDTQRLSLPAQPSPVPSERMTWGEGGRMGEARAAPRLESELVPDPAVYRGSTSYPGPVAKITGDGVLRHQRVIGVTLYPVQYDPLSRELIVHQTLLVEVRFLQGHGAAPVSDPLPVPPDAFDEVLQAGLLNFEVARDWRQRAPTAQLDSATPWVPPAPAYRVRIENEGMYRVTREQLAAAGVPVDSLDPRTFRMFNQGTEVAIHVEGEQDGHMDAGDSVQFYGRSLASKYTRFNVYWLTFGEGTGLRMGDRLGAPDNAPLLTEHPDRIHLESNLWYWSTVAGGDSFERFVWTYLHLYDTPSQSFPFTLAAPAVTPGATAILRLSLFADAGHSGDPMPAVRALVNSVQVGEVSWSRGTWHQPSIAFSQSLLSAGQNTVTLQLLTQGNWVEVDWFEIEFANTFAATADLLAFRGSVPGTWRYAVSGISTDEVAVFDVSDPSSVQRMLGATATPAGSGYTVTFQDTVVAENRYLVLGQGAFRTVNDITSDSPSSLEAMSNWADYVLIAHPSLVDTQAVTQLLARREAAGLRTMAVDVQDVYDQFAYGVVSAQAIHDFLAYALGNWRAPAPVYVVLVGDGTEDPKDYQGFGRTSYLPPYLAPVDPWLVETAADNRFVTLVGSDAFPDMIVGRLAVNSEAELQVIVEKTVAYETNAPPGTWKQSVLFAADDSDAAGDFDGLSDGLISCCLPAGYQATKVYYRITHMTEAEARAAIQTAYNAGQFIVNYIGHAGTDAWAAEGLLRNGDLPLLQNGSKLPIMLPMTCLEGHFQYAYPSEWGLDSLGERIVRHSGGGAVASWSPSGLGVASGHDNLNRGFFDAVFQTKVATVGQATMAGKLRLWQTGIDLDTVDTYILFGDPALRVNPAPTAVWLKSFGAAPASDRSIRVQWETSSEVDNLGFNLYRSVAERGPLVRLNSTLIPSRVPPGSPEGAAYEFVDGAGSAGGLMWYWLEDVDIYGKSTRHGPVQLRVVRAFVPVTAR